MPINEIQFYEGEKREVVAIVRSPDKNEIIVIASSEYELRRQSSSEIIENGNCEINGNKATVFIAIAEPGNYELKIKSCIGREVIISKSIIKIRQ